MLLLPLLLLLMLMVMIMLHPFDSLALSTVEESCLEGQQCAEQQQEQ